MEFQKETKEVVEILNIRKGFATNSSSTHSIILDIKELQENRETTEFGWQNFVLKSREDKLRYLSVLITYSVIRWVDHIAENNKLHLKTEIPKYIDHIKEKYDTHVNIKKLEEYINTKINKSKTKDKEEEIDIYSFYEDILYDKYIDHQSVIYIPKELDDKLSIRFMKAYEDIVLSDGIIICGGNDNSNEFPEEYVNVPVKRLRFPMKSWHNYETNYILYDEGSRIWTLINYKYDFYKVLFRMDIDYLVEKYSIPKNIKLTNPQLVDIKITDHCTIGCKFCYQNSKDNNKHVSIQDFEKWMKLLSKMNVLEIAIGGGEPLQHPSIFKLLEIANKYIKVVNLTTKDYDFITKKDNYKKLENLLDAIGISISSIDDMKKVEKLKGLESKTWRGRDLRISFHIIPELLPIEEYKQIVKELNNIGYPDLLLLGYKETGRGNTKFIKTNLDKHGKEILEFTRELYRNRLAIDVSFAKKTQDILDEIGIDKRSYYTEEGLLSMYLDLVESKIGKSSYEDKLEHIDCNYRKVLSKFQSY